MYSLSSCWNSDRHKSGRDMLLEIRDLGFEYAELSHGTRVSLMSGILEAVEKGEIKISSVHNFCPLPIGVTRSAPNLYQFTDLRERHRELALKHTRKTFEFAERVKAPLVVLHLGSLELPDYNTKLEKLLESGGRHTDQYRRLCQRVAAKREARKRPYVANLYAALKELIPEAEAKGLRLGAECREAIEEIPLDTDFHSLFQEFPSPNLVYWHDTGHAQIKDNLGFIHHASQLEALSDRLYGFHIHDVQFPGKDHCPVGKGMIDWAALKPFVKPTHLKVLELNPGMSVEDVKGSFDHIREVWGPE
jgi:sugar phosphate isomerase/epimerase